MKRGLWLAPSGAFKQLLHIQSLLEKLDLLASAMKIKSVKKNLKKKQKTPCQGKKCFFQDTVFFRDQLERKIKETVLNCLRSPASTVMNYNKNVFIF